MVPYITEEAATRIEHGDAPINVGELTYQIQQDIEKYLYDQRLSYKVISEIKAALLGAYDDFQERIVKPYEARKCDENGDVWHNLEAYL